MNLKSLDKLNFTSPQVNPANKGNEGSDVEKMGLDLRSIESGSKDEKIKRISIQFEEILVKTLLNEAFKDQKLTGDDEESLPLNSGSFAEMRTMFFSQHISDSGGLGYQKLIEQQIRDQYYGTNMITPTPDGKIPEGAVEALKAKLTKNAAKALLEEQPATEQNISAITTKALNPFPPKPTPIHPAIHPSIEPTTNPRLQQTHPLHLNDSNERNKTWEKTTEPKHGISETTSDTTPTSYTKKPLEEAQKTENQAPAPLPQIEVSDITPPVPGKVTSSFGWRLDPLDGKTRFHNGTDYRCRTHTPVKSFMDGIVTFSGWKKGYGRFIEIQHGDGYITRYGHNAELLVKKGDIVKSGDTISLSGNSGRSTGPHLHFELQKHNLALNPEKILENPHRYQLALKR